MILKEIKTDYRLSENRLIVRETNSKSRLKIVTSFTIKCQQLLIFLSIITRIKYLALSLLTIN